LLAYLLFRNLPQQDGKARLDVWRSGGRWGEGAWWWAQPRESIAADCRLTENELRGAVRRLTKRGLIACQRGRYYGQVRAYYGRTILHFRLGVAQGQAGITCWPSIDDLTQMRVILGGEIAPLSGGETTPGKAMSLACEGLGSKPVGATLPTSQADSNTNNQVKGKIQSQTPPQAPPEALPPSPQSPSSPAPKKSSYVDDWKSGHAYHPDKFPALKKKQKANLVSFANRAYPTLAKHGADVHDYLRWIAGEGWDKCRFAFIDSYDEETHKPMHVSYYPSFGVFNGERGAENEHIALNLFLDHLEEQHKEDEHEACAA
jgi:hypothetical protein